MGMEELLRASVDCKRQSDEDRQINYFARSQERLSTSVEKKLRTTFIGALSIFEEAFGHLWGYRLPESELTDEQFECRKRWEFARTKILNNGNNQLRTALKEISEYSIEWNRHRASVSMEKCPQNQQNQQNYQ